MFSLQRILGHDKKFFELLEASAIEGKASIAALRQTLTDPAAPASLETFAARRRKDKSITIEIAGLLCRTFVTAIEREDIESLATALYKIPKIVEKFAERYLVSLHQTTDVDFSPQIQLLEQAIDTVSLMVGELHKSNLSQLVELNARLQNLEAQGDELIARLTGELYHGKHDPIKTIILKDLFELLEKAMDRCRTAGNVMARVALKHS